MCHNDGQNAWEERQISCYFRESNHDSSDLPPTYGLDIISELFGTVWVKRSGRVLELLEVTKDMIILMWLMQQRGVFAFFSGIEVHR